MSLPATHAKAKSLAQFSRRQVVEVRSAMGDRRDRAVIIGANPAEPRFRDWYVVQFPDARLSVHASNMRDAGERPFKGPLPTYRSTQR